MSITVNINGVSVGVQSISIQSVVNGRDTVTMTVMSRTSSKSWMGEV